MNPQIPTLLPSEIEALTNFRASKPWRGSVEERKVKFQNLHDAFNEIHGKDTKLVMRVDEPETPIGDGGFSPTHNAVGLMGKLSVVTYLFAYQMSLGASGGVALEWAKATYRLMFPASAARMVEVRGCIINPSALSAVGIEVPPGLIGTPATPPPQAPRRRRLPPPPTTPSDN